MKDIYSYKQTGELYPWKYTVNERNYPGFHMSWADNGKASFAEFLELLRQSLPGTYRTLKLKTPTQMVLGVPNNRPQKVITRPKLKVELSDSSKAGIDVSDDSIDLRISISCIDEILRLLPNVKSQNELSVHISKTDGISFWW